MIKKQVQVDRNAYRRAIDSVLNIDEDVGMNYITKNKVKRNI